MDGSDVIMSTTCYNTMTRNVNGSRLNILLTKDRHTYKDQKRRYQHGKIVYISRYLCLVTGNFLVHVRVYFVI